MKHPRIQSLSLDDQKNHFVVGIDFGTTYSGVAFAYSGDTDTIGVIKQWPGAKQRTSEKIGSLIIYEGDGTISAWGAQAENKPRKSGQTKARWFKLLLDDSQSNYLVTATQYATKPFGMTAVEVATDYLRLINTHLINHLKTTYGSGLFECTPIEYFVTVPAIWSDKAQAITRNAAINAGIQGKLEIVREPEAAAIACAHSGHLIFEEGDRFLVCDAGGGTVDLISYEVTTPRPLKMKEITIGTGGLCGATYLDREFEKLLREKLSKYGDQFLNEKSLASLLQDFDEYLKVNFGEDEDEDEFSIILRGCDIDEDEEAGISAGCLIFTRDEIVQVFDPVINKIIQLIEEQVTNSKETIKTIFLVGGFGSNGYLRNRIQGRYPHISVQQPVDAWSAVVRGAVIHGLREKIVTARHLRRSYGVSCNSQWDPLIHDLDQYYVCEFTGHARANDCMSWYARMGHEVQHGQSIKFPFCHKVGEKKDRYVYDLLCSDIENPPRRASHSSVTALGQVVVNLTDDQKQLYRTRNSVTDGFEYYELCIDISMKFTASLLKFEILLDGKVAGEAVIKYE
ncbi:Heat shock protein 12B [Neolecta irregularis DAH-3]|uniref:Heat shock protein 12B n=1 Tax=Neolecta irregularis (strain DAH-3) TaxID=1198029 RepID=A0A1U7LV27_NEOID|nr:Heat shock protein 12B [Neolecta irregularis DAH-3]|eukprot:OLL26371.1 Heat shock protein 12B [Neolecta irregularis DAH-3]